MDIVRYANAMKINLTRCFQQELGLSPVAYQAVAYPERMNITAVAQAVSIVDSDYFSRVFRQETGLSPREFKHHQQNPPTK